MLSPTRWDIITRDNVDRLEQVAVLGRGQITAIHWLSETELAISTATDTWLYDISASSALHHVFSPPTAETATYAISPDARLVAVASQCEITLRALETGEALRTFSVDGMCLYRPVFSENGAVLAGVAFHGSSCKGEVYLWDIATGNVLRTLEVCSSAVPFLSLNAQGTRVAVTSYTRSTGTRIVVWEVAATEAAPMFSLENVRPKTLATLSADGSLMAVYGEDGLTLWNTETGIATTFTPYDAFEVPAATFSATNDRLAVGVGGAVHILTAEGERLFASAPVLKAVHNLALSPNATHVAANFGDAVYIWDTQESEPVTVLQGFTDRAWSLAFNTETTALAAGYGDGYVRLWNLSTFQQSDAWPTGRGVVRSVVFTANDTAIGLSADPDNDLLAAYVQVWHIDPRSRLSEEVLSTFSPPCLTAIPADSLLVWADGDTVYGWDVNTQSTRIVLETHMRELLTDVALDVPHATLAAVSEGSRLQLWRVQEQVLQAEFPAPGGTFAAPDTLKRIALSPDGTRVIGVEQRGYVAMWNVGEESVIALPFTASTAISAQGCSPLAFNMDGSMWAAAEKNTVVFRDAENGQLLDELGASPLWLTAVAFSPDGRWLATASQDGTVRIWGVPAEEE